MNWKRILVIAAVAVAAIYVVKRFTEWGRTNL